MAECIDHGVGTSDFYLKTSQGWKHRLVYCAAHQVSLSSIAGKMVRHTCDNKRCINPDHLLLGSHLDNVQDAVDRNRYASGEDHYQGKLTWAIVHVIRARYIPRCRVNGTRALGREFNVHQGTVSEIVRGLIWKQH